MEELFDRQSIIRRRLRARRQAAVGSDFLMRRACEDLADRLAVIERRFVHAVSLFNGSSDVAGTLQNSNKVDRITRIEADSGLLGAAEGIVEPGEIIPLAPQSADLVVSLFALHEINDVPGLLMQIIRTLRPDGLLLAAFAGSGTLAELRDCLLAAETEQTGGAAARIYPFMDVRDAGGLLQRAGFALPVTDVDTVTVRYDTVWRLMQDLRAMGATNALAERPPRPMTRSILARTEEIYRKRYCDGDGRIRATFNTVWISGWAPDASQPKPLKPGSATTKLSDALKTIEDDQSG